MPSRSKLTSLFSFCLSLLMVGLSTAFVSAQDVPPLTDDEKQATEVITERVVKSTLIFLASDALEGRGTPSRGFDIACEYVAARFRGAGLKGLGKDGSYFQETTVNTVQVPSGGSLSAIGGETPSVYGMLSGGKEDVKFTGSLEEVDPKNMDDAALAGLVVFDAAESGSLFRQLGTLGRHANKLSAAGATGIVLRCKSDSPLIAYAKSAQLPKIENRRVNISLPIILIDNETKLEGEFSANLPKLITGETIVRNTVGILEGSDPELKDEAIIITAHLDHLGIGGGNENDRINNGADDNASGSTGVMSLADAFGALETAPKRSVIFMTYWGEERGLLGSRYYCDNPLWPLEKTVANINLEMIGRPEAGATNKCWMTGWEHSDLGTLMARYSSRNDVEIFDHPKHGAPLYRASDNYSFVDRGVIAHSFSAGSLHSDYHQVTDEWEKMNTEHMTQVIRGLFAASLPLANGDVTPTKTAK